MARRKDTGPAECASSLGHRKRLRERWERCGIAALAPHEVLELLLTFAIPRRDVKGIAKLLLARFSSLRGVLDAPEAALQGVPGVGPGSALFLHLIRDIARLYLEQKTFSPGPAQENWRETLRNFWRTKLSGDREECLEIAYLDSRFILLPQGVERLASGAETRLILFPRQIVGRVLLRDCAAIVLCHNHPSGDELPSEHDERVTRAIDHALRPIGVQLLDHWIVAAGKVFSLKEQRTL